MKHFDYQKKAIDKLLLFSQDLLDDEGGVIIFQSPTGSGKTLMMAETLLGLSQAYEGKEELAYLWISINSLHEQSQKSLEQHFETTRSLECLGISDIQDNELKGNQILFVNWEKLNKKKNLFIRDNERDWNLQSVIRNTKQMGRKVVLIIDESHRAAKAEKATEIIEIIAPDLTVEVSATPKDSACDHRVQVKLQDVIEEGMIKKEIQINPDIADVETNADIVETALRKRRCLKTLYERAGTKINPLLLVQIPDKKETDVTAPEERVIDVLRGLGVSTEKGNLAVWLSDKDKKINLEELEKPESAVEVLIFKQAIAVGWDCPRAHILLLQREWNQANRSFNIQTLGRIMRMPERKHYEEFSDLNVGYVYAAWESFSIVDEIAKDYVSERQMRRDNERYGSNLSDLTSTHVRRKREQTRLSGDFRICLFEAFEEMQEQGSAVLNTNVTELKKGILAGAVIDTIDETKEISGGTQRKIKKTEAEINLEYTNFLVGQVHPFSKSDSTNVLKSSLRALLKEQYDTDDENRIALIVLGNRDVFIDLIDRAKLRYQSLPKRADEVITQEDWQVPQVMGVQGDYDEPERPKSIMQPYLLKKNKNGLPVESGPETSFITELEKTDDDVLWWYKNGERESKFFGIAYQKDQKKAEWTGFYPDFLIKTKRQLIIVEIKDDKDYKLENILKMRAGRNFVEQYEGKEALHFFILSPSDYVRFFAALKQLDLTHFHSGFEERLLRFSRSQEVVLHEKEGRTEEESEMLALYEEENKTLLEKLEDEQLRRELAEISAEEAKTQIKSLQGNIEALAQSAPPERNVDETVVLDLPKPFFLCILGEVTDENEIRSELQKFFSKLGFGVNDWDVDFYNNTKLLRSDVLKGLKKGQSKYHLIITGQIHHHSGKGNESANLLTELKKEKYIPHVVGGSPKTPLTAEQVKRGVEEWMQ